MGVIMGCMILAGVVGAPAPADPADDALARLHELSRQAEQTTEAMHSAELDLSEKLAAQRAAEQRHAEDQAGLDAARARLAAFQSAVDRFVAAMYMGGRMDGVTAMLTAEAPQQLLGKLAVQRVISTRMAEQMAGYRAAGEQATKAERASAKSAADARTAAEQAAAVRANLQAKQSRLQVQIAAVKSQYRALTPEQRTALADPGPVPAVTTAPGPQGVPPGEPVAGGAPGTTPPDAPPAAAPGASQAAIAVQAALTQIGAPYAWGGAAPGGFDCSGLVMWAFQQAGIALPHSSQALAHGGQPVALSDLQPGDVLTFYSDASHAGIYIGDGLMVHSSTYGQPVRVVPMTASGPVYNARRY
ncbi:MAG: peptidoglycan hydrolase RipC [Mycobacterium sp.]|uniref:peptidoglycan hydrolase RipC n=1 Tax=Mycobacterium sp. TaxID=1785 RepID=UPI00262443EB|nr:peptidoglycan hydrolase RipC [Mycobacterium sp.]MDI3313770.1 peptidoglycan hydrolase RipC [Mycobacterium sp.]